MRQITSKSIERKKSKRNRLIVGGILVVVLLVITLGFAFQGGHTGISGGGDVSGAIEDISLIYNGLTFTFSNQHGRWLVSQKGFTLGFIHSPTETRRTLEATNFTFSNDSFNRFGSYQTKPLYISSENTGARDEVMVNLGQLTPRPPQEACIEESGCPEDFPIKTCEDNFIIIQESGDTSITQQQNCVFIEGREQDLIKLVDAFLLKVFEID